jgi:hypothetical protein
MINHSIVTEVLSVEINAFGNLRNPLDTEPEDFVEIILGFQYSWHEDVLVVHEPLFSQQNYVRRPPFWLVSWVWEQLVENEANIVESILGLPDGSDELEDSLTFFRLFLFHVTGLDSYQLLDHSLILEHHLEELTIFLLIEMLDGLFNLLLNWLTNSEKTLERLEYRFMCCYLAFH